MNTIKILSSIFILLLYSASGWADDFYVSPQGDDTNPGTLNEPLATITGALEKVKSSFRQSPDDDCHVWLMAGIYRIQRPVVISSNGLGNSSGSLIIAALQGAKVIISGGKEMADWHHIAGRIWKIDYPLNERIGHPPRELFIDGRRAIRARHPNKGYLRVNKVGADRRTNFYYLNGDFPIPANPENTELVFFHDWSISRILLKTIDTIAHKLIAKDTIGPRKPDFFNLDNWEVHPRYILENDRQFMDVDYEWFYDQNEEAIFLKLPPGISPQELEIVVPVSEGLLNLSGTLQYPIRNIHFKNIIFEHSAWNIPDGGYAGVQACHYDPASGGSKGWNVVPPAIQCEWLANSSFTGCVLRHLGGSGIWLGAGAKDNTISGTTFSDISGNGVMIGENTNRQVNGLPWWKSAPEQVASGNTIEECKVSCCGVQFFGAVGIWCGLTSGTTIRNNDVYELPYTGISVGWMWSTEATPCRDNLISGNHIHHIMKVLSDGAGIYMLGLQPGSKIIHNLIHDVPVNSGRAESNGIFLDEGSTDLLIADNVIYNIAKSPLRFHKATTNTVRENKLFCLTGIPPIRYNSTDESDIARIGNQIAEAGQNDYEVLLQKAIRAWKDARR